MEDLPGNLQPDLKAKRIPRPSKRGSRWTLLFVGDHGQTVSVRRFKSLFYLLMALLLVAVGAAAGLYLFNRQTFDENQRLRAETHRLREAVEALRYEKDVLTARLVLTEAGFQKEPTASPAPPAQKAKSPSDASGKEKSSPEKASAPEPEAAPEPQLEPEPVPVQELPAEQAPAPGQQTETDQEHAGDVESRSMSVSVENLAMVHEQDRPLLRVTFVIRKGDDEPESISGHAFVVLKQENDSIGDSWVLIPWAKVEEGRPSPADRGQFFSIARFKPMKFETTGVSDPGRFDRLTVYIFNTGGELILEKDFSMTAEEIEAG